MENREERRKRVLDVLILLLGFVISFCILVQTEKADWLMGLLTAVVLVMVWVFLDLVYSFVRKAAKKPAREKEDGIRQLILLDDNDKPVKSWDLQGRISLIIGKAGQNQELDIDLSDCEYSSFVDFQHAVLNFCLDQWYVEDLESQNGVKVRKVEDGECYRVIHRPCKVSAGDVLYIANTKLLLT